MKHDYIFDFGMNNGDDTAFYLSRGYNVIAVEADPELVESGRRRFSRELESGKLQILSAGISEHDGFGEFWICEERPQFNSFIKESASRGSLHHRTITIPTVRPASLFERFGVPCYLKIDIEGYEQHCLADLSGFESPQYISLECHHFEGQGEQGLLLLDKLVELGYRKFKLINQFSFCAMPGPPHFWLTVDSVASKLFGQAPLDRISGSYWLARHFIVRTRLQHRFRWPFPMGSSGVWGEDTNGRWVNYRRAKRLFSDYRRLYSSGPTNLFWCDWHAAL